MGMPPPKGLRDEFAMAALAGLVQVAKGLPRTDDTGRTRAELIAEMAFAVADAMMIQRLLP